MQPLNFYYMSSTKTYKVPNSDITIKGEDNIANYVLTQQTNQTNQQIAQMSNEWNYNMMKEQMKYNVDMWNKQNEYNSPVAQKERLREAGFNPYLVGIDGNTAGNVGSVSTPQAVSIPNQAPPAQTMNYFDKNLQMFGAAYDTYMRTMEGTAAVSKAKAETEQIKIDNATRGAQALQQLAYMKEQTRGSKLSNQAQKIFNYFAKQLYGANAETASQDAELRWFQKEGQALANVAKSIELGALPEQLRNSVALGHLEIRSKALQNDWDIKRIEHEEKKMLETEERTSGIKLDNKLKERTSEDLAKKITAEREAAENNKWPKDWWQESFKSEHGSIFRGFGYGTSVVSPWKTRP